MNYPEVQFFDSHAAFDAAWSRSIPGKSVPGDLRSDSPEAKVERIANFVAGTALADGFRLFKNGGTPLIEKRRGTRVYEIVFRASPRSIHREYAPFQIQIMVSDRRLKYQREIYWPSPSTAPSLIAGCQLEELQIPPRFAIYNAYCAMERIEAIAESIQQLAQPWFTQFLRPTLNPDRLRFGSVSFVRRDTALELMLLERGEEAAADFLYQLFDDDVRLARVVRGQVERMMHAQLPQADITDEQRRISTIASRLGLLAKY